MSTVAPAAIRAGEESLQSESDQLASEKELKFTYNEHGEVKTSTDADGHTTGWKVSMRVLGQILLAVGVVVIIASIVFGRYHGVLIGSSTTLQNSLLVLRASLSRGVCPDVSECE